MNRLERLLEIVAGKRLLFRSDLMLRYGCTEDTLDKWHRNGTIPKGTYLPGARSPMWSPGEIADNEIRNQKLARRVVKTGAKKL
jgi:hypothetical protein